MQPYRQLNDIYVYPSNLHARFNPFKWHKINSIRFM